MANFDDCLAAMRAASNRELSDDEIDALQTASQARQRQALADGALDAQDAALQAAEQVGRDIKQQAFIERRQALLNAAIRAERLDWLRTRFGKNPAEGIEAMLVGVNRAIQGARRSVMSSQKALRDKWLGGFVNDLEKTGYSKIFASGSMDREVSRALSAMGQDGEAAALRGMSEPAVAIARVMYNWGEYARTAQNKAGAWIGKEPGYIVRQSHDMLRIRNAGFDAWRDSALRLFDLGRMMRETGSHNVDELLHGIYANLASGNHLKAVPDVAASPFKGPGNLAKRASQQRVIHFKDADSWFEYNQNFGARNLREAFADGLIRSADRVGIMRQLGTNPGAMVDSIRQARVDELKATGRYEDAEKLAGDAKRQDMYLSAVDGRMNIADSALWAQRSRGIRAWQATAKLGGMIASQFNDIAVYGSEARYQGRGFLSGMGEAMSGLGKDIKGEEKRDLLAAIGVFHDSAIGEIARTGSLDDPGALSKWQRLFFKLNLGDWWSKKMSAAAGMGMSHHLALQAGKTWEGLHPDYQRVLGLYDIGPREWDVVRQSGMVNVDGRSYITPDTIGQIGDDVMRGYLDAAGKRSTDVDVAAAREDLADKVQTYFNDRTGFMQLEPDAKTRAILLQGTQPGTWLGEFMRFVMQFKSFTGAYIQKIMGRELYGRGFEGDFSIGNSFRALAAGNGEAMGLINVVLWSTLFGYGSMVAKQLLRGQTPQLPSADPVQDGKLFLAAMAQGGGLGIMGDFLFGEANRMGGGMLSSVAGPALGLVLGDIPSLYQNIRDDLIDGKGFKGSVVSNGLRTALNNTPFVNLFYTRIALDYLLVYRMQEMLNPGYLQRMESRVRTQNGQSFILPPSQNATVLGVR